MEEPTKTTFGKLLRAERKRLDLTQQELADKVGTNQQNIGGWEAGRTIPKQDARDKLLEVFGKNSPLALLPYRGEITLSGKATMGVSAVGALSTFTQLAKDWAPDGPGPADIEAALLQELPNELKGYVGKAIEFNGKVYRPDYLSPGYCIEIKRVTGNRIELVARTGMQQLMVYRAALARGTDSMPAFVLILVLDQITALGGKGFTKITAEAELLGIHMVYCNHVNAAAMSVEGVENGNGIEVE